MRSSQAHGGILGFISDVVVNSAIIIVAFYTIQYFLFAPFQVVGNSMLNTLNDREYIVVSKIGYYFEGPDHGDVVVFHPPSNAKEYYIKRIIGIPGDEVRIANGHVFVNGKELEEPYLRPGVATCLVARRSSCPNDNKRWDVPEGKFFVLGDNRDGSSDSRAWYDRNNAEDPFVELHQIQGNTKMVVYPLPNIRLLGDINPLEVAVDPT
jgi:signal peptidase I